jgi:hypothetical protein
MSFAGLVNFDRAAERQVMREVLCYARLAMADPPCRRIGGRGLMSFIARRTGCGIH